MKEGAKGFAWWIVTMPRTPELLSGCRMHRADFPGDEVGFWQEHPEEARVNRRAKVSTNIVFLFIYF